VGTIVNIVQSLKLPDGNIRSGRRHRTRQGLQISETEGYMQVSVRVLRYATETNPRSNGMQRVTALFEQYNKALPVAELRDHDRGRAYGRSGQATDTIAANLQLHRGKTGTRKSSSRQA
jgi:ATP-dependent Lon protease